MRRVALALLSGLQGTPVHAAAVALLRPLLRLQLLPRLFSALPLHLQSVMALVVATSQATSSTAVLVVTSVLPVYPAWTANATSPTHALGTTSALAVEATATAMIRLKAVDTVRLMAAPAAGSVGTVTTVPILQFVCRIAALARRISF